MYNLYLGYMIRSSFWKFLSKKILGKYLKLIEEYFFLYIPQPKKRAV